MIKQCRLAPTRARGPLAVCVCVCVAIARSHCNARAARARRAGGGGNGSLVRAPRNARVCSMHCACGARSHRAGCGSHARLVCVPARRIATRVCGAHAVGPRAQFKDARPPTRSRGPHLLGAARVACARTLPHARGATATRGQREPRARAKRGVCRVPSRASMCGCAMCAAMRGVGTRRPTTRITRSCVTTHHNGARAPLYRSVTQWCMGGGRRGGEGARAMRVCVCAVTHRHQQQIGL